MPDIQPEVNAQEPATPPPTTDPPPDGKMVLWMLFSGTILYTFILLAVAKFFPGDMQLFTAMSGIASAFVGAFFLHINNSGKK